MMIGIWVIVFGRFDYLIPPEIKGILEKAKPEEAISDLKLLIINILLYIKRSNGEILTEEEKSVPAHRKFKFLAMPLSPTLKESLQSRLNVIEKYRIESSIHVREILLHGLTRTEQRTLTSSQLQVLKCLSDTPQLRPSPLSKRVGLSRPAVKKILRQLQNEYGLGFGYFIDYSRLKLTTFSLVFQTHSYEESIKLEKWASSGPPFLKTLVFDIYYRKGYIVFAIPTQQRALRSFEHRVDLMDREFFQKVHIHKLQNLFWNLRFDNYDVNHGTWIEPLELLEQSRATSTSVKEPKNTKFQHIIEFGKPIKFTQMDYLLAHAELKGAHTLIDKRELLKRSGFSCSEKTVWAHLKWLRSQKTLNPYMYISNAGFEEFICISTECNQKAYAPIYSIASKLPFTYTYQTNFGIAIFLKQPIGWSDFINSLIDKITQIPGVNDVMVIHQERNVGSAADLELYRRWNEKRQYWEFDDQDI
ncbi:MAG: winged helix-turn-helix transcriptional regulator [Promethearchaeota archaeon]